MSELLEGFNACISTLESMGAGLGKAAFEGLVGVGYKMQGTAKGLAPVRTGALRESINLTSAETDSGGTVQIAPGVSYAVYVEYGTGAAGAQANTEEGITYTTDIRGHPPHPYMRPAFAAHSGEIEAAIAAAISGAVSL